MSTNTPNPNPIPSDLQNAQRNLDDYNLALMVASSEIAKRSSLRFYGGATVGKVFIPANVWRGVELGTRPLPEAEVKRISEMSRHRNISRL